MPSVGGAGGAAPVGGVEPLAEAGTVGGGAADGDGPDAGGVAVGLGTTGEVFGAAGFAGTGFGAAGAAGFGVGVVGAGGFALDVAGGVGFAVLDPVGLAG